MAQPARSNGPSRPRLLWRGLTRRCPVCGERHIFDGYFRLKARCPRCGLRFVRLEGQWSGDIGINTIVTFTLLYLVLLGGTLAMWGHVNVAALAIVATLITFVFPVLFVPVAKTLWVAVDLAMRPLEPGELGGADETGDTSGEGTGAGRRGKSPAP